MEPVLEVRDGTFTYGEGQTVLRHIQVSIYEGERVAVVGSNGAGKSTFFLLLNGVLPLQNGEILYRGMKIGDKRKNLLTLRKSVGLVFQEPDDQIIASTVEGEISFGLFNLGMKQEEIRQKVGTIMEEMNLQTMADRPPHLLSGGEKKSVSVADVLVMEPEVVLFDEPTASLDGRNTDLFREQIELLHRRGVTLMISTHDMNFVWEWADRVLVFAGGELIGDDVPESIFGDEALLKRASLKQPILYRLPGHPKSIEEITKGRMG